MMHKILRALASLRLTVALLAMAMVLIFVGTLAQTTLGIWHVVDTYFRSLFVWIDLQLLVPRHVIDLPLSVPFPGGFLIAGLMIVNLIAAHAMRFKFSRKRIGIVMLHAGVIVLLLGEFVTGFYADEGMMTIHEGGSANYVVDFREAELVVIDASDPDVDRVTVVPESKLLSHAGSRESITHADLPFAIEIDDWIPNARLLRATGATPATRGVGLEAEPEELPRARGVDGAQTDSPAAYVTLHDGTSELGTWLLFADLIHPQPVQVGEKTYHIALRFRRTYRPYTLHLIEFRHDKFVGTEIPRNFSSRVRLVDPTRGTDREVLIWMNNPLRYAGETFYQASYLPDGSGTVLQVVRNPGALLPYIACGLVGGGMTLHFVIALVGYLRRLSAREAAAAPALADAPRPHPARVALPWAVAVIGLVIAGSGLMRAPAASEFDLERFASLPVTSGGRVKPMDSAARHVLMVAGGRQSVRTPDGNIPATRFLLDLMAQPEAVRDLPVVRVDHPDVLALLQLRPEDGGRISLGMVEPHWPMITEQAARAFDIDSKRRDPFQRAVVSLYDRVSTILAHSSMIEPYVIPPLGPDEEWRPFHEAFLESDLARSMAHPEFGAAAEPRIHPAVAWYIGMMTGYSERDADTFNSAVGSYDSLLRRDMPSTMRKADLEVLFNRAAPFIGAMQLYVLAFLLVCGALLLRMRSDSGGSLAEGLRTSAVALLCVAFVVHTLAIVLRIYLQERPPVTNLYSSAVFVGWAAVLLGLLLERWHRLGIAALGAATIGFATLVVAHNLGSDGDTMQMMQAVLDSNFWLATHVIVITLGYSATFLAGTLAILYVVLGVFTTLLTAPRAQALARMVYGVICFALLLSFVGTVLGGIWADQSWGRFWGWDPKENGAALIVLLNAIILHARWGGFIRERGIMVLAIGGNIVTAWSWFGTNMLGIGLHSYGFMDSAVFWLMAFVISQLVLMAIALVPTVAWRSFMARRNGPSE